MSEYLYCITTLDGKPNVSFKCPSCGSWGDIDDDQFNGRVSVWHGPDSKCTFHETINIKEKGQKATAAERFNWKGKMA